MANRGFQHYRRGLRVILFTFIGLLVLGLAASVLTPWRLGQDEPEHGPVGHVNPHGHTDVLDSSEVKKIEGEEVEDSVHPQGKRETKADMRLNTEENGVSAVVWGFLEEGWTYAEVRESLTVKDVQTLARILKDPAHIEHWGKAAHFICISKYGEDFLSDVVGYIRRWDNIERFSPNQQTGVLFGKLDTIPRVGLVPGKEAVLFLRDAVTQEGARKLTAAWDFDALPAGYSRENEELIFASIRGEAALGLIYTQDPEGQATAERMYHELLAQVSSMPVCVNGRLKPGDIMTKEEIPVYDLFFGMAVALANRDLIKEIGPDEYERAGLSGREGEIQRRVESYDIMDYY